MQYMKQYCGTKQHWLQAHSSILHRIYEVEVLMVQNMLKYTEVKHAQINAKCLKY